MIRGSGLVFLSRFRLLVEHPKCYLFLWQDNYFSLLPGETRQITTSYRIKKESTLYHLP
jgi:hypothetical protein